MKSFFHGAAALSGLIIGVGIFGVPYVTAQVGFWVGLFWIGAVGALVLVVHLLYGEIVSATPGTHRLPGYVGWVFGKKVKKIILITDVVRFWGLQLAYLIVGGTFLAILLQPYFKGDVAAYSVALFAVVALITFFGLRIVDRVEFYLAALLVGAFLIIVGRSLAQIDFANLLVGSRGGGFFSPYGVIMVSLSGAAAIPEIWDIVKRNKKTFRASIIFGTLIPLIVTALFALAVVGVTGINTSEEAISGLQGALGHEIVLFGAFVGFLAIITSYMVIALYLQEVLKYDFLVKHTPAWGFAVGVPLLLFLMGAQSFISVIDVVGSVLFGIEGIVIVAVAIVIMRRKRISWLFWKSFAGIIAAILLSVGVLQKLL